MEKLTKHKLINNIKDEDDKSILKDILLSTESEQEFNELIDIQAASDQLSNWKSFDSANAWDNIQNKKSNTRLSIFKYAAVIILLLSVGLSYLLLPSGGNEFASGDSNMHIVLQDGSDVILYPNSILKISDNFNNSLREVSLDGDAYFNVAESDIEFSIDLEHGNVDVLGTVFYIDQNDKGFKVDLISGSVKVNDEKGNNSVIERNQSAIVNENIVIQETLTVNDSEIDDLKLDNVTIKQAIDILNNIYGKNIIELENLSSSLANKRIHTTVKNSSARDFINGLKLIFDVRVINTNGIFIISES